MMTRLSGFCLPLIFFTVIITSCNDTTYTQGGRLYKAYCADCHGDNGEGLSKLIPPLAGADYLRDHQDDIACIILKGQKGPIIVNGVAYNQEMPGKELKPVQITNIINFINHAWENDYGVTSLPKIKEEIENCRE